MFQGCRDAACSVMNTLCLCFHAARCVPTLKIITQTMENKTGVPLETHPFLYMIIYLIPKLLEEKTNGLSGFNSIRLPSDFRTIGSPKHGSAERDLLSGNGVKSV